MTNTERASEVIHTALQRVVATIYAAEGEERLVADR